MKVSLERKLHWWERVVKGEMTQEMSVDILGRTDWSRQINQTAVRWMVYRKTKRQMDTQTAVAREWMVEMGKKGTENERWWRDSSGLDTIWHKIFHCFCFLKTGQWTLKSSKNPTISVTAMAIWSSGSEKDGLVHFYCLANAPNSPVCSSIIHSILLFPSKLPPRPLYSPSKFSLSHSHSSFVLSVPHCESSEPGSTSRDTLKMNGHGSSQRIIQVFWSEVSFFLYFSYT